MSSKTSKILEIGTANLLENEMSVTVDEVGCLPTQIFNERFFDGDFKMPNIVYFTLNIENTSNEVKLVQTELACCLKIDGEKYYAVPFEYNGQMTGNSEDKVSTLKANQSAKFYLCFAIPPLKENAQVEIAFSQKDEFFKVDDQLLKVPMIQKTLNQAIEVDGYQVTIKDFFTDKEIDAKKYYGINIHVEKVDENAKEMPWKCWIVNDDEFYFLQYHVENGKVIDNDETLSEGDMVLVDSIVNGTLDQCQKVVLLLKEQVFVVPCQ